MAHRAVIVEKPRRIDAAGIERQRLENHVMTSLRLTAAIAIATLAFAACSSGPAVVPSSGTANQLMPAFRAHAPSKGDLYVADRSANAVKIYAPGTASVKAEITDAPAPVRIAFTKQGVLAVASQKAARRSPTIFLYKANATTSYAKIVLPVSFESFTDLAFDPKGVLYVANAGSVYAYKLDDLSKSALALSNPGSGIRTMRFSAGGDLAVTSASGVELYKPGSAKPWGHIAGAETRDAIYDAGAYLSVADYGANRVSIFPPGAISPSAEITNGIDRPGALAVDAKNDLYVASLGGEHHVTVYSESGTDPIRTIAKTPFPEQLVVAPKGDLYVDSRYNAGILVIEPGQTKPTLTIRTDAQDIAISP